MNAPGALPRWPKGPFPERYRYGAVEARLLEAWTPAREELLAQLAGEEGLAPTGPADPWVRLFRLARERDEAADAALRARAREAGLTLVAWIAPARARREGGADAALVAVVPTADPVEAVSLVGVAGPVHGIGMPAIVRFLVTLRSFGAYDVVAMGEDALELTFAPRDDVALARVAERVVRICPPLARKTGPEAVAADVRVRGRLAMDWA